MDHLINNHVWGVGGKGVSVMLSGMFSWYFFNLKCCFSQTAFFLHDVKTPDDVAQKKNVFFGEIAGKAYDLIRFALNFTFRN